MTSRSARARSLLTLTLLLGVLLGCGLLKKKPGAATSASAAVAVAPAAPPAVSVAVAKPAAPAEPAPVTDDAIPTAEDFEDEAFEKVTDATYKPELDTLRKEIEGK
jgi:hypothetical protein